MPRSQKVLLKKNNCESLKDLDKKYLNKKNKAYTDFIVNLSQVFMTKSVMFKITGWS